MNVRLLSIPVVIAIIPASIAFGQPGNAALQQLVDAGATANARNFYMARNYELGWTKENDIDELVTAIRTIDIDGLEPENYNLRQLEHFAGDTTDAQLDLALTEAFFQLAHDLYQGQADPEKLFPGDWDACVQPADYVGLLQDALNNGSICETLDFIRPMDNGYEGLKYMLSKFREIALKSGFPEVGVGVSINPGDLDDRMVAIRTRLFILGLIPEGLVDESVKYDSLLIYAVQKFQRQHDVWPDGIIGPRTQQALAWSAEDYIETIVVNLERYRWHQSRMAGRSIKINIPTAKLTLANNDSTELEMKVIIGRSDRRTPVLSSVLTMITVNPTWTIPPTILREDVLPAIIVDKGYLAGHNIRVLNNKGIELNADSLPWSAINPSKFPYTLREDPGPRNPLGLVKFSFPNDHSVYLHDTNMPSLFANADRALSSGCIRLESPMALARILIEGSGWTEDKVREEIKRGETKFVLLRNSLPIHITYFTANVTNGELLIARDIYRYDRIVLNALRACKPRL